MPIATISQPPRLVTHLSLLLTLACLGCQTEEPPPPRDASAAGSVVFDDNPLSGVHVNFYSMQHGNIAQSTTDANGQFSLSSPVPTGDYVLYFSSDNPAATAGLPNRYLSETSSDRRVTLKPGENPLTIELPR